VFLHISQRGLVKLRNVISLYLSKSLEEIQEKVNQNFVEKIARLDIDLSYLNGK
jgi:succinate dehydrogenase flavin-adding protein (antitoxin of CptAB toxin-antitoxin module)